MSFISLIFKKNIEKVRLLLGNVRTFFAVIFLGLFLFAGVIFSAFFLPTISFPVGSYVEVPKGASLVQTANTLKEKGLISSSFLFRVYVHFFYGDTSVVAGRYFFSTRLCLINIAERVTSGDYHIPLVKILIPEGFDIRDISEVLKKEIPGFDYQKFIAITSSKEGYLFPDTYLFFDNVSPEEVFAKMKENFQTKIKEIAAQVSSSKKTERDIIIMASIIEREVVTTSDRKIVSGILWKRIGLGMPLQVDAAFDYVNGKTTKGLTLKDLQTDSPYNTYTNKGLPPGPICNPGIDALVAATEPTKTSYLYYLSDSNGVMHYAKSFEEHKANKTKYLK